jgi:hypothetical protein
VALDGGANFNKFLEYPTKAKAIKISKSPVLPAMSRDNDYFLRDYPLVLLNKRVSSVDRAPLLGSLISFDEVRLTNGLLDVMKRDVEAKIVNTSRIHYHYPYNSLIENSCSWD